MDRVTVFGGSGFVGRYIVKRLASEGAVVRVAVRRPEEALFLKTMGLVGQIAPIHGDVRSDASVRAAVQDADTVINTVGFWDATRRSSFDDVHHLGAARVARLSAEAGARQLVHLSGIGASETSRSKYVAARARGDAAVMAEFDGAIILQPSVIFGQEDRLLNLMGRIIKNSLVFPVIAGDTKLQPVYVGDVADAALAALKKSASGPFQLGGPRVYSHRELIDLVMALCERDRLCIGMPMGLASILAGILAILPGPTPLSKDTLALLQEDNVVSDGAADLESLGLSPAAVETIAPTYLDQYRPRGRYRRERMV